MAPFISATASKVAKRRRQLAPAVIITASKLGDGESYRIAIVSESPLEYWTVWGESAEGQKKPFRFAAEPSAADIKAELGEFVQRQNYELRPALNWRLRSSACHSFAYDFADSKIKVFEITQKTLIKELDKLSQDEDYRRSFTLGISRSTAPA